MKGIVKEDTESPRARIQMLASDYFSYLARAFPVMCASDEFHFMVRAEEACGYYDLLDNMDQDAIKECIRRLRDYSRDCERLLDDPVFRNVERRDVPLNILEDYIDLHLLLSSMSALRVEFEDKRSWSHNPLLYLKIGFVGVDHALGKPAESRREGLDRAGKRLGALPVLLEQAEANLRGIPDTYHRGALEMIEDCLSYLDEITSAFSGHHDFARAAERAEQALNRFGAFLENGSPVREKPDVSAALLEKTLREHFQISMDIAEIMDVARTMHDENLSALLEIENRAGSGESWLDMYNAFSPCEVHSIETLELYRRENRRLREHFAARWRGIETDAPLSMVETPVYLGSIRGSASFSAAFSGDPREESLFYITTVPEDDADSERLRGRLHREFRFITAHETFPGHHLLDHSRRKIANPVRRQIESPLFYEGWATYAESLLIETGYVENDLERLVFHKRNLWRAARCIVDVGLTAGTMSVDESRRLLQSSGSSEREASAQIRRFRLNPGYQLCYTLGLHEIVKLRNSHDILLGSDRFHQLLLGGGEIPFSLIALRLNHFT